jgi:SagB-type dehydrogenase family enzyme
VEEALLRRRSVRRYARDALSLEQLSQLLWSAQGLSYHRFRTAPSAGATYPLEVFAVAGQGAVAGLEGGIYRYGVKDHSVDMHREGEWRGELCRACLNQHFIREAPLTLVLAADMERTTGWYGRRGERYVHYEAGHVAQNLHLQAVALGLGSVPVGAYEDGEVSRTLSLPRELRPLYIVTVGKAR